MVARANITHRDPDILSGSLVFVGTRVPARSLFDYLEGGSKAKRAKDVPHLARLQSEAKGKTRITIMLDNDLLMSFRAKAEAEGTGYQTLINQALRQATAVAPVDEATLRRVLREELKAT